MPGWGDMTDPLFVLALQQMLQQQQKPVYTNAPPALPNMTGFSNGNPTIISPTPPQGGTFSQFGDPNQVVDTGNDYSPDPYQSRNYLMNQGLSAEDALKAEITDKKLKQDDKQAEADRTQNLLQQGYTPEDATVLARGMMQNAYISPDAHQGMFERQQANIEAQRQKQLQDQLALDNAQRDKDLEQLIIKTLPPKPFKDPKTGQVVMMRDAQGNTVPMPDPYGYTPEELGLMIKRFRDVANGLIQQAKAPAQPPKQIKGQAQTNLNKLGKAQPSSQSALGQIGETAGVTGGGAILGTINDLIGLGIPPMAIFSRLSDLLRTKKIEDITAEDLRGLSPIQYAKNVGQGK